MGVGGVGGLIEEGRGLNEVLDRVYEWVDVSSSTSSFSSFSISSSSPRPPLPPPLLTFGLGGELRHGVTAGVEAALGVLEASVVSLDALQFLVGGVGWVGGWVVVWAWVDGWRKLPRLENVGR